MTDVGRILSTWARDAAAFAFVLARHDPAWRSEAREVAGGWLVLSGRGLYVNRALAAGVSEPIRADHVDTIIDRSRAVGVGPAVEVSSLTRADTTHMLRNRGFVPADGAVTGMAWPDDLGPPEPPDDIDVRPVHDIAEWQRLAIAGWEIVGAEAQRASDAFVRAAAAVDGDGLLIAYDRTDGRPLGAASLTIRDGMATLGGMSTLPAERRRGVQRALVAHRIVRARAIGCDLVTSSAHEGGASERNLRRLGFVPITTITTWHHAGGATA